jgi:16S rRNA (guanine(966)-N(2))-methyltransferase RsmD
MEMRVVAGRLRGRRLHAARGRTTRPTTDRARAGLFDWLGARVAGARILDLYAGTGSLGIEALSRGAEHVTFVERDPGARAALERNRADLDLGACTRVIASDVVRALPGLRAAAQRFDLVLADPPYGGGAADALVASPDLPALIAAGGLLVVERGAREPVAASAALDLAASRAWGEARFDRYHPKECAR